MKNKNFNLMVAGQIVTVLGSSLLRFALSLYVLDITGRLDVFATLFAVSSIPTLLSPIGGAISDRFDRKRLMVLYDFACCGVTIGLLIFIVTVGASVFAIGVVMVLLGIIGAMETPNGTACIPQLVPEEKLESANGIIQAVQSLSGVAAPILGGILYGSLGIKGLLMISSAAFALAAITEMFIKIPFTKRERQGGIIRTISGDLKSGFTYVVKERFILKIMIIAALLNLVLVPCFIVSAPIILRVTMGMNETMYGVGMGLIEFSMILGAVLVGVFSKKMKVKTMYRCGAMITILTVGVGFSVTPMMLGANRHLTFILFMACIMLMAAATTILSIFAVVQVQKRTPNENLGKVMAIIMAVAQCAAPLGQFAYGIAMEHFFEAIYIPLFGICGLMLLVTLTSQRMLRNEE
jgi:MFS family permease